jgi:N-acetylmuramic acid 6-phosphate etherase
MDADAIVRLMDEEERATLRAVADAAPEIAITANKAAEAFRKGGRVVYVGAGTSGRVATADAAEMPPTFGIDPSRFVAVIAGGSTAGSTAVEDAEDDSGAAIVAMNELELTWDDIVIGIAASGTTPFVVAAVRHARQKGLWTCGIANNPRTPLLEEADLGILLDTGPEVLTGSTRLKAGTAQKLALNRISTAAMVLNGKVVQNLMVDVKAKNAKLKTRCARIVNELTGITVDEARQVLESNNWSIRAALDALKVA